MKFADKLRKIIGDRRISAVAEDAQINPGLLNNYLNRGSEPGAMTALKIAKALKVPLEWLIDDAADLPVPEQPAGTQAADRLSDRELMMEVAKRHRREVETMLDALDQVTQIHQ